MQQQLIVNTIEIVPATMEDVLSKIQALLSAPALDQHALLPNIVKSLFFGLWNFDKMVNQHNLSTKISELLLKIPKKNGLLLLRALLVHLHEKWNFIDHHRINKFMQLVRYLIAQAFRLCEKHKLPRKKVDSILIESIFDEKIVQNGLVYHIIDIYFELAQQTLPHPLSLHDLAIFEDILTQHSNEHMRLYVAEHVYEKYKDHLIQAYGEDLEKLQEKVEEFASHFLEMARKEEKELQRKNLYSIVGYAKSEEISFAAYLSTKREKALLEVEKRRKKVTKAKKVEIRKLKEKRKEKKKHGIKTKKIISAGKFESTARSRKGIEEL